MNRFLKPVLAGATLLTLAVPALASAQPYDGYGDAGRRDYSYAERGDYARSYRHDWRDRDYGYGRDWRYSYSRHHRHHFRDGRYEGGWR